MILSLGSKISSTASIGLLIVLAILILILAIITYIEKRNTNFDSSDGCLILDTDENDYVDDDEEYVAPIKEDNTFTISLNNTIYDKDKPLKSETVVYVLLKLLGNNKEIYYTDTNELATKLNMPASTIRASLKKLEDKKLISRDKELVDDKMVKKIVF